jgi:hypothetical protein
MSDNFGPKWVANTDDMLLIFFSVIIIGLIPVFPLAKLGWYLGEEIIGNNISKWILSGFYAVGGYMILNKIINKWGGFVAFLAVFFEYLSWDWYVANENGREMIMVSILKAFANWALSNT